MKSIKFIIVFLFVFCTSLQAQNNLAGTDLNFRTTDSIFCNPYIDMDEWRDNPVRHRYVHGGFNGTGTRFSFYFPPEEKYEGRFFQYVTPFPDNENLSQGAKGAQDIIGFSVASGAYFIETNGGGPTDFTKPQKPLTDLKNPEPTFPRFALQHKDLTMKVLSSGVLKTLTG